MSRIRIGRVVTVMLVTVLFLTSALPIPVAQTAPNQQIFSAIATGVGIVSGVGSIAGWLHGTLKESSEAKVEDLKPNTLPLELGLTAQIDWSVEFRFEDSTLKSNEWVFFEVYVVLGNTVLHYERYPESGYVENPKAWFDDSLSKKLEGSIHIGAKQWPCKNVIDELKVIGIVWDDTFKWHDHGPYYHRFCQVGHWSKGGGFKLKAGYMATLDALGGINEEVMKVTVVNPYYVEVKSTSDGTTKGHAGTFFEPAELFDLSFNTGMHYSRTYPKVSVDYPTTATVTVDRLDLKDDWVFSTNDLDGNTFTFRPAAGDNVSKTITFVGRHGDPDRGHPGSVVVYEDKWGAKVSGKNKVYYTKNGTLKPVEYEWGAYMAKGGAGLEDCASFTYTVKCDGDR
jgi:hypothetical protein